MGLPSGPRKGVNETAAEKIILFAPFWLRSVCRKERKFALSSSEKVLLSPDLLGHSQL
jgi:hypothetical protein